MIEESQAPRVALVTGAGSGIGFATAERLAGDGYHVICGDLAERGAATRDAIVASGGSAEAVRLDVSQRADWEEVAAQLRSRSVTLRALVNNAGITRDRTLLKMTDDEFETVLAVHLRGSWLGCQTMLPFMQDVRHAAIVNISSSGRHGSFGQSNYAAAKAGIVGLTKTVALEAARYDVRCNAVAPGSVRTPMLEAVPERTKQQWLNGIALARFAEPAEIASAIAFLLSPDASYITGHVLDVNGLEQHS